MFVSTIKRVFMILLRETDLSFVRVYCTADITSTVGGKQPKGLGGLHGGNVQS